VISIRALVDPRSGTSGTWNPPDVLSLEVGDQSLPGSKTA
jgi:hypothetical protein